MKNTASFTGFGGKTCKLALQFHKRYVCHRVWGACVCALEPSFVHRACLYKEAFAQCYNENFGTAVMCAYKTCTYTSIYTIRVRLTCFMLLIEGSAASSNLKLHTFNVSICAHFVAGEIDFHFFVKYEWPAGVNDAANSAFAQQRIDQLAPYVTSTQVSMCM